MGWPNKYLVLPTNFIASLLFSEFFEKIFFVIIIFTNNIIHIKLLRLTQKIACTVHISTEQYDYVCLIKLVLKESVTRNMNNL